MSLVLGQLGVPRRYLTFMYLTWGAATLPFLVYAFGTALWQFVAVALFEGACMAAGMVVWGTLMSTRVPPELRGRVHSFDWFVSIGLTPISFALTGPVSSAIGIEATLVLAALAPALAMLVLYVAAGLRRDEERYADAILVPPDPAASAAAAAGTSTAAIS
jgi:MFS family permease